MNASLKSPQTLPQTRVAMIGFGEAAAAFLSGWAEAGLDLSITAYDIKTDGDAGAPKWQDYRDHGVDGRPTCQAALAGADLVFSLVTADRAGDVAAMAAPHLSPGTLFLDGNSCAPKTKQSNGALIEAATGRYVDMAIMAPVLPSLHKTPILLSGPHAQDAERALGRLEMAPGIVEGGVGRASSIKMVRSIMVKGLEALVAECVLAGRLAGVEDRVFDSLEKSYPGFGWHRRAAYNLERIMLHGPRRAAEMDEVARMVSDLGLAGGMAQATADWQREVGALGLAAGAGDMTARADLILSALGLAAYQE